MNLPKGHAETLKQWIVICFLWGLGGVRFWIQLCSWVSFLHSAFCSFLSFCTFAIEAACVIALQHVSVIEERVSLKNFQRECWLMLSQLKWVSEWEEYLLEELKWQPQIGMGKGLSSQFYCCTCLQSTFAFTMRTLWVIIFCNLLPSWSGHRGFGGGCKLLLPTIFIVFDSVQVAL